MELSQAALFAAGGSIVAFWNQLKSALSKVSSLIIRSDKIEAPYLIEVAMKEILKDSRIIRWGSKTFCEEDRYVTKHDGYFRVISSNHPEVLDNALTRCGRIDAKIEVGPLPEGGRRFIAQNILRGYQNLIEKAVKECDGMVAADFENHCIELAIKEKNKEHGL